MTHNHFDDIIISTIWIRTNYLREEFRIPYNTYYYLIPLYINCNIIIYHTFTLNHNNRVNVNNYIHVSYNMSLNFQISTRFKNYDTYYDTYYYFNRNTKWIRVDNKLKFNRNY